MSENHEERDAVDTALSQGLAAEADPIQVQLEQKEDIVGIAKARFKKLGQWIHAAEIRRAENLDSGDRVGASDAARELQELGERYRISDDTYRPRLEEVRNLESELEALAGKWGVPPDEKGWSLN